MHDLPTTTIIDAAHPDQVYICNDAGEFVDAPKSLGPDGMLRVVAKTARTGVQQYLDSAGQIVRRYRPPEEVFKAESMASWSQKPVTMTHPPVMVDATNARQFMRGASGPQAWQDGKFLMQHLFIADADLVKAVLDGSHRQVSNGYYATLDRTPGTSPDGEAYDEVMRDIRGNHVAMVPKARGGADLQPRLDAKDAGGVARESEVPMAKMRLNGVEREVPDALVDAIQAELNKVQGEIAARDAELTTVKAERDAAKTKVADATKGSTCDMCGAPVSGGKYKAQDADEAAIIAKHQAATETKAAAAKLGITIDAKDSVDALRRKILAKTHPAIALDGKDEAFVEGLFRGAMAMQVQASPTVDHAANAVRSLLPGNGGQVADAKDQPALSIEAVDAARVHDMRTSHLRPIGVHRG